MAIDVKGREMSGPIPGENYTSDTKNYPWHRPPEYTDLDDAIEASFKKLTEDEAATGMLTMVEMGIDIATLTDMFVTAGISAGKWTPDFAILLAGPVSHIIYMMAKGYGLDCDLGLDQKKSQPTKVFFDEIKKINHAKVEAVTESLNLEAVKTQAGKQKPSGGFMGASPTGEAPAEAVSADQGVNTDEPEGSY